MTIFFFDRDVVVILIVVKVMTFLSTIINGRHWGTWKNLYNVIISKQTNEQLFYSHLSQISLTLNSSTTHNLGSIGHLLLFAHRFVVVVDVVDVVKRKLRFWPIWNGRWFVCMHKGMRGANSTNLKLSDFFCKILKRKKCHITVAFMFTCKNTEVS